MTMVIWAVAGPRKCWPNKLYESWSVVYRSLTVRRLQTALANHWNRVKWTGIRINYLARCFPEYH